jgi:hypothetical protein
MLTDGDPATYWKSNPYLTTTATGEPDAEHPQWVVVDLGEEKSVNAIGIAWTNPFAVNYKVQFWEGDDAIGNPAGGAWKTFPNGTVTNGVGGTERRQLSATDMSVRFVRVLMSAASGTFDTHGTNDARNSMGYAIAEVSVGTLSDGRLTDAVKHSPDKRQTATFVSSTDPWHAPDDKMADTEQPGLDFIFTNGITRGLPALVPVGLLYSTPDNALAEIKYLRERGYAISHVEIGEEPDGQHCTPEDYAALYLQWASALHGYDATLKLGGPAFQEGREDVKTWPDANGETSWLKRFIKYLSARGKLGELNFMSFEHYPFEPCANAWTSLADEPGIVRRIMAAWRADGLPTNVPILCTEYNFSWDATAAHQQLAGALWHADFVGSFLAAGGAGAYYYQYEPLALVKNSGCGQWGAFGMFTADASRQIKQKTG